MFNVVLYQPEIPPNAGNIIRLCANTGSALHLITEARVKRAGLDYHELADVHEYADFETFIQTVKPSRLFALSTRGTRRYTDAQYQAGDAFLFGPETRGLPQTLLDAVTPDRVLRLPMRPDNRSLNLSNAVAVVVFEAWRQAGFQGGV
jgi:tRNA (cytidine/uridine-2'-O-)-methyltransferase